MPNGGTMLPRGRGRPNLSEEDKIAIVRAYAEWKTKGGESPIQELMKKYNISRNTPAKLWNKLLTRGTVLSQHKGTLPPACRSVRPRGGTPARGR